jgi:hypothetical protein
MTNQSAVLRSEIVRESAPVVPLGKGKPPVLVPSRFVVEFTAADGAPRSFLTGATVTVTVVVIDGVAGVESFKAVASRRVPLHPELVDYPLAEWLRRAIQAVAYKRAGEQDDWKALGRAARQNTRKRRITPDDLRRVLDLYERAGVQAVMAERETTERNAFRLIARARKELS